MTAREIIFTKMHGAGNDYVYINCLDDCPDNLPELARKMSDRHFGVGSDGIVLICPSEVADFKMRIFNADGSEARMCGNGSRCVAKYVHDKGLTCKSTITLETLAGIKTLTLHAGPGGEVDEVTVDMGEPEVGRNVAVETREDGTLAIQEVSMGNPHGVVLVDSIDNIHFETTGPELENHALWADRANIEFVETLGPGELRVRVWERGSGETLACGTGACASAVAAATLGRASRRVTVHLKGGDLEVEWREDNRVYMRGGATTVYEGVWPRRI